MSLQQRLRGEEMPMTRGFRIALGREADVDLLHRAFESPRDALASGMHPRDLDAARRLRLPSRTLIDKDGEGDDGGLARTMAQ